MFEVRLTVAAEGTTVLGRSLRRVSCVFAMSGIVACAPVRATVVSGSLWGTDESRAILVEGTCTPAASKLVVVGAGPLQHSGWLDSNEYGRFMYSDSRRELYKYRAEEWASKPVPELEVSPAQMFAVVCGGEQAAGNGAHFVSGARRDAKVAPRDLTPAGLVLNEEIRHQPTTR